MKQFYRSLVFEMSLYYLLLVFSLPLVYAVTYHLPFMEVYNIEWFAVSLFCYPVVLIFSAVRYIYRRMKGIQRKII